MTSAYSRNSHGDRHTDSRGLAVGFNTLRFWFWWEAVFSSQKGMKDFDRREWFVEKGWKV